MRAVHLRIDMSEINDLLKRIMPQVEARGDEWAKRLVEDFRALKPYGIDMCRPEIADGAIKYIPTEEFYQHLKANGITV
jgi:hypothetical protein